VNRQRALLAYSLALAVALAFMRAATQTPQDLEVVVDASAPSRTTSPQFDNL